MFFVAQLGTWALFVGLVQRPRLQHFAPYVAAQTAILRLALRDRSPYEREQFLASLRLNLVGNLRITPIAPPTERRPSEFSVRWFFGLLRPHLAPDQSLAWQSQPQRVLWVRTPVDTQHVYWVGFPAEGFVMVFSDAALALLAVSILVALVGALLIQFGLIPPLKALEAAALRVEQMAPTQAVTQSMPLELKRVATSFNRMQEILNARDRERALMLAGISHDLRTPLTKLWLGVEMLKGQADVELLDCMTRSVQTAEYIIDQFIYFAREGDTEPMVMCNIPALVRDAALIAVDDPMHLRVDCGAMPQCFARPIALRRMVSNLVNNAVCHGSPPIVVHAAWNAGVLSISVTDHGQGVPPALLHTVTQPFIRLDQPQSGRPGTGLGLAIVERLARAHGGELRLDNGAAGGLNAKLRICAESAQ